MKKKYEYKESFMHFYAKEVLYNWLTMAENIQNIYCNFAQFDWKKNYGIHKELKFYETSNPYYFELSKGLIFSENRLPIFDKNIDRGKILFIPDITLFHKGTPKYLFEICHTHFLDKNKLRAIKNFFNGFNLHVIEIDASYLLSFNIDEIPCQLQLLNCYSI